MMWVSGGWCGQQLTLRRGGLIPQKAPQGAYPDTCYWTLLRLPGGAGVIFCHRH